MAVDDIDRDIARMEKDVEQVRARADRDRARLDAGTGPARELEALQHELATLTRRQGELEDAELELMEQREQAQRALDVVAERLTERRARRGPSWSSAATPRSPSIDADREFRRRAGRRSWPTCQPT